MSDPVPSLLVTVTFTARLRSWRADMLIDCDTCAVRDIQCGDCVMTVLLGPREGSVELDSAEQLALGALANGGLLPPLRLVPTSPPQPPAARNSAIA